MSVAGGFTRSDAKKVDLKLILKNKIKKIVETFYKDHKDGLENKIQSNFN